MCQGREFGLAVFDHGKLELISHEPEDQKNGFREYSDGVFTKPVKKDELESVYSVGHCARFQGIDFGIMEEEGDRVRLVTNDPKLAERLKFSVVDQGEYAKWVQKEALEKIWEGKVPVDLDL